MITMTDLMCATRRTRCTYRVPQGLFRVRRRGEVCAFTFFMVTGFTVTLCVINTKRANRYNSCSEGNYNFLFITEHLSGNRKDTFGSQWCLPPVRFLSVGSYWMEASPSLFNHLEDNNTVSLTNSCFHIFWPAFLLNWFHFKIEACFFFLT